jgi:hypothetical protein
MSHSNRLQFRIAGFVAQVFALALIGCGDAEEAQPPASNGAAGMGGGDTSTAGAAGADAGSSQGGSQDGGTGGAGTSGATTGGTGNEAGSGGTVAVVSAHALVATTYGGCGLDAQGSVHCWGLAPAEWPVPAGTFVELAGQADTVCAIRADRTYVCFPEPYGMPGDIDWAPDTTVLDVAADRSGVCVIDEDGVPQCGQYSMAQVDLTPPADEVFERISAGVRFACGLRAANDDVICWGEPGSNAPCEGIPAVGQLDPPVGAFQELSSGAFTSCAIDDAGAITCWGAGKPSDDPGMLCGTTQVHFGQADPPEGTFISVAVDVNHSCAIRTDGTLACWGAGMDDSCTLETDWNCRQSLPPDGVFVSVATGLTHSCAMTAEHKVQCWGNDGEGEFGGRTTPPAVFQ